MIFIYDDRSKEDAKRQISAWKKNIEDIKKEKIGCALWCVIFLMIGLLVAGTNEIIATIVMLIFICLIVVYFIKLRGIPKRIAAINEMIRTAEDEILTYTRSQEALKSASETIDKTNKILAKNIPAYAANLNINREHVGQTINTYLTGTNYHGRKKLLKQLQQEAADLWGYEKYDGLTGKELREEVELTEKVWEYPIIYIDLELVHEKDNIHDENAIAVFADIDYKATKIGYIPREDNEEILEHMNQFSYKVTGTLLGGKYKEYDYVEEKVISSSTDLSMEIEFEYE